MSVVANCDRSIAVGRFVVSFWRLQHSLFHKRMICDNPHAVWSYFRSVIQCSSGYNGRKISWFVDDNKIPKGLFYTFEFHPSFELQLQFTEQQAVQLSGLDITSVHQTWLHHKTITRVEKHHSLACHKTNPLFVTRSRAFPDNSLTSDPLCA